MRYVRLVRMNTNSYLTYELPSMMEMCVIEEFVEKYLTGWAIIEASVENKFV